LRTAANIAVDNYNHLQNPHKHTAEWCSLCMHGTN